MSAIFDVRNFTAAECEAAIAVAEGMISLGDKSYRESVRSLRARLAELNGKKVDWVLPN